MTHPIDLLSRPVYHISQVDRLLALKQGTSKRWILGYRRGGRVYESVIRPEANEDMSVTWGEFVETRLLAEYRDAGVPLIRMRPAIVRLRSIFATPFPLAMAKPFLDVEGKELVYRIQGEVELDGRLQLVVARNNQLVLSERVTTFMDAVVYDHDFVTQIRPVADVADVVIDPLRQFGRPVVRSVPTENIAELVRAGDSYEMIAELYDLSLEQVRSAVRYELIRGSTVSDEAA